jgi:putative inorganic carbon (HCO3(-)) transporter
MIDWLKIVASSFWLAGLALVLAVAGYEDYLRSLSHPSARTVWRAIANSRWTRLGALLFCTGMALTGSTWLETGLWALVGAAVLYGSWRDLLGWQPLRLRSPQNLGLDGPPSDLAARQPRGVTSPAARDIAKRIIRLELVWLGLLAIFILFPNGDNVAALLGLPALWVVRRVARGRFVPRTPLDWAIALILLMLLVSLFATPDINISLRHVCGLLFGIALYYAIVEWASTSRRFDRAVYACALGGMALAAFGLVATNWADKFPMLTRFGSKLPVLMRGLPGLGGGVNPNELAGSLVWVLPLQLAVLGWSAYRRSGRHAGPARWRLVTLLSVLSVALTGFTMILTQSRGGFLGLALGIGLLVWIALPRLRLLFPALLLAGVAVALVVGPQTISDKLARLYGQGLSIDNGLFSLHSRTIIWAHAVYGIEDFPITGMGMDTFHWLLPILYPISEFTSSTGLPHAHDQFLQAALDLGLPGLVAYLAIWMAAFGLVILGIRGSPDRRDRVLATGMGASLLAYFVFGVTDVVPLGTRPGLFFWALLALLVAVNQKPAPSIAGPSPLSIEHAEAREPVLV